MTSWDEWFEERFEESGSFLDYLRQYMIYSAPFIDLIIQRVPRGGKILEVGAALGLLSIILNGAGYRTTATDVNRELLSKGKELAGSLGCDVHYEYADLFNLPHRGFDCVASSGVMEHFERAKSIQGLQSQAKCARFVAVAIPSRHVSTGLCDDHPILLHYDRRDLERLCEEAGLVVKESVSFGGVAKFAIVKAMAPPVVWRILSGRLDATHAVLAESNLVQ